jgi:hypothetical protein
MRIPSSFMLPSVCHGVLRAAVTRENPVGIAVRSSSDGRALRELGPFTLGSRVRAFRTNHSIG